MSENETAIDSTPSAEPAANTNENASPAAGANENAAPAAEAAPAEEISYHAVEKDGVVTANWEMQGRKHLRTIDPRSEEGRRILGSYTVDDAPEAAHADAATHAGQSAE